MNRERAKEIVKAIIESPLTYREIANKFNVSLGTVNNWAKKIKHENVEIKRSRGRKTINIKDLL